MKKNPLARLATLCFAVAAGAALTMSSAQAADDAVKIGFITDLSGLYADIDGQGGLEAIRMAIADFGGKVDGKPITLVYADHQNKADIAASRARERFDRDGVDMLIGGTNSATGLSMNTVAGEKHKVYINIGAGADTLTNEQCTPYTIHYAYDTTALANGTGSAVTKQGGKTWYFLTADYAFGKALEKATSDVVKANGGQVLGAVRHPLSASDFSSFLLQAQSSKAKVIGLANAGLDTTNSIKQAAEFGIVNGGQKLAALLMTLAEVNGLGLQAAQGLVLTEGFYWDRDDKSRAFGERFMQRTGRMPNMIQAGTYSATLQYLKAVKAAGTKDSDAVVKKLKELPVDDAFAQGKVLENGRMVHDLYLFEVKKPSESKKPWDYYKQLAVVPGDKAFPSAKDSGCPLTK
jgi:branched-chain amino acid transport system substrate-binding protein